MHITNTLLMHSIMYAISYSKRMFTQTNCILDEEVF